MRAVLPRCPDSTSPLPAEASQPVPLPLTRARPPGSTTSVVEPFSSTVAPKVRGELGGRCPAGRRRDRPALLSRIAADEARELSFVWGQQRRAAAFGALPQPLPVCGHDRDGVGVDQHRYVGARGPPAPPRRPTQSVPSPGPTAQACTRPAASTAAPSPTVHFGGDDVRESLADQLHRDGWSRRSAGSQRRRGGPHRCTRPQPPDRPRCRR